MPVTGNNGNIPDSGNNITSTCYRAQHNTYQLQGTIQEIPIARDNAIIPEKVLVMNAKIIIDNPM